MYTDYGARIIKTGTVYMHGPLNLVQAFIAEYSDVAPLELIVLTRKEVNDKPLIHEVDQGR